MARNVLPARRAEVERQAWVLLVEVGLTVRQAAAELGLDPSTVCRMRQRVERRLCAEFAGRAFELKANQTERLEALAAELLVDYRSSKGPTETVTTTTGRAELDRGGNVVELPDEVVTQRRVLAGDAALAAKVLDALAAVRKIWGLDAPQGLEITGAFGGPVQVIGYEVVLPGGDDEPADGA